LGENKSVWLVQASEGFGLLQYGKALDKVEFGRAAAVLLKIVDELKKSPSPPDGEWRTASMADFQEAFVEDFGDGSEMTRDFRKDCLSDLFFCFGDSAFAALELADVDIQKMTTVIDFFWARIVELNKSLAPVNGLLAKMFEESSDESKPAEDTDAKIFHLYAYMYLLLAGGFLADSARLFYFHTTIKEKKKILNVAQLQEKSVRNITEELTNIPIFLQNWDGIVNISNAISQANAIYIPEKDDVHLISRNQFTQREEYNEVMDLNDFVVRACKLKDTLEAFILVRDMVQVSLIILYLGGF